MDALALLPAHVELHLRGDLASGFGELLRERSEAKGIWGRVRVHPPCAPNDLVRESSRFDIGLALETCCDASRLVCETNKLFVYALAGLSVVASDTPAQAAMRTDWRDLVLFRVQDAESLAQAVTRALGSRELPNPVAAGAVWDWGLERSRLVSAIESAVVP